MTDRLEHWRKKYAGGVVTIKDDGHRLHIRPADEGACWMEVVVASGQVIWVGDFEPIIFRDYRTRTLKGWLEQITGAYVQSPGYGSEKIGIGMCSWWRAASQGGDSPICDMDLAREEAVEYLDEWLAGRQEEGEEPSAESASAHEDAVEAVERAELLAEVYSAVMEVSPDAFEAKFGAKVPDGLWRCAAAAEVMLAHLEAQAAEVTP
jgi:hypothetical protein